MNKYFIILLAVITLASCKNSGDKNVVEVDTAAASNIYSWEADLSDSTGGLQMKKVATGGPDSLEVHAVIRFLNNSNPQIQLQLVKTSNDTIYVKIPDANYLTQQMGSSGPSFFFAETVYNLTEIPGFKYVNFDFEEGDHAAPGTLNRDSFKNQ